MWWMIISPIIKRKINLKNSLESTKIQNEILLKTRRMSFVNKPLIYVAAAMENKMKLAKDLYKISKFSLSKKTSFYSKILICNSK